MRKTRLGVHHMQGGADTREWSQVATAILCVEDFGPALEVPPGTHRLGRVLDDGRLWGGGFDMNRHCLVEHKPALDMARAYYEFVLRDASERNPQITHWLGPNENVFIWSASIETPGSPNYNEQGAELLQADREEVMRWCADFIYELARILWWAGKRLVFGNWSWGHPHEDWNLWPHYVKALQACRDWGAVHACHAYGPHDEQHALRYRADHRVFTQLGYPGTPIALTECGAENAGGMLPWRKQYGSDPQRYFDEWLVPFALALEDDDYVFMAALFSSGRAGNPAWEDYDVTGFGLARRMADWSMGREPLGDLMAEMTQEDLQMVDAASAVIETEAAKIRAIAAKYLAPPPWWQAWPEGTYALPGRALAIPNRVMTFYHGDGVPFNPQPITKAVNWTMWVVERRGNLLNVFDQAGTANDWWVRAEDVSPA
jgi:hypothetical protein